MCNKRLYLLLLLIWFCERPLFAQVPGRWYSYYDTKKNLAGFKDVNGKIKIAARFNGLTKALAFDNIIAVTDAHTVKSYYLLKSGKRVGNDSVYIWDMTFDCEQEGKIRFRDPKTDKVGFFGTDGNVLIPAIYSDARPFYNGLAIVLYNGNRVCADGNIMDPKKPCEHWSWDGITALIDNSGKIVADSLHIAKLQNINWYSLNISNTPADTMTHISFKAKEGGYYSFVNYEKEFKQWFYQQYLNTDKSKALLHIFKTVCVEGVHQNNIRRFFSKNNFKATYEALLIKKLKRIKVGSVETQIISEPLNNMIFNQPDFKAFYTDCGDANEAKYPVFDVITTRYNSHKEFLYQEHFSFLRTANGYMLFEIAWKKWQ